MPQAALAIAAASISNAIGFGSAMAIFGQVVLMSAVNAISESMLPKEKEVVPTKEGTVRDANAPLSVVYGKRRVGGPLVYWTTKDKALYYVVAFCEHEIQGITDVLIDGVSISDPKLSSKDIIYETYNGLATQTVSPLINGANPSEWDSSHEGKGVAYIAIKFGNYEEWTSIPNVSVIMEGAKVYDPRKDSTVPGGTGTHRFSDQTTWEYSTNPALIALHYLTSDFGFDEDISRVDLPAVMASANVCDQLEEIPPGGVFQKRYECNIVLSTANSRKSNMKKILQTMRGSLVYVGGKWRVLAGAGGAAEFTITEDDILDDLTYSSNISGDSHYNYVSGNYIDPNKDYDDVAYPPARSATFEARDGGRRFPVEINFEGVTDPYQAQRLSIIHLKHSAHQKLMQLRCKPKVLAASVQSLVAVNTTNPSLPDYLFRVVSMNLNEDLSVTLTLQEEFATSWDVALNEYTTDVTVPRFIEYDPLAIPAPTNFAFFTGDSTVYKGPDGVVLPRAQLTWDPLTDQYLDRYRLQWKKSTDTAWQYTDIDKSLTEAYLILEDQVAYDFEVFGVNALEKKGAKASLVNRLVTVKTTGPDQPGAITYTKVSGGVDLTIDVASVNDTDISKVELWFSTTNDRTASTLKKSYPAPSDIASLSEMSVFVGLTGVLYVWARLWNTSGQAGAWNTLDTSGTLIVSGVTAEDYGQRQGVHNLVYPTFRSRRLYDNTIILGAANANNGLPLSSFDLRAGDYVSASIWWQDFNATSAQLEIAFYDGTGVQVGSAFTTTAQTPPATLDLIKLEGVLVPVGAVKFSFKTKVASGQFWGERPVFNRGMTVIDSIGSYGDRFLDPNDDTNLEWGDFQNLLDGQVEAPVDEPASTTGGGGPVAPPSSGGGYYLVP